MPDTTTQTLPPATERSSFTSWAMEKLRLGDTDRQGHVNNAVFATFAETGRIEFMRDDLLTLDRTGLGFVVVRVEIDFRGELHWPGKVDIGTRLLAVGRTSWRLEHGVFSGERCVATAVSVMVTIDVKTRRPTPLPDVLRTWLEERVAR
ncbi:MAG: acyl-CoA thioesterase [Stellaceae bacterium]